MVTRMSEFIFGLLIGGWFMWMVKESCHRHWIAAVNHEAAENKRYRELYGIAVGLEANLNVLQIGNQLEWHIHATQRVPDGVCGADLPCSKCNG